MSRVRWLADYADSLSPEARDTLREASQVLEAADGDRRLLGLFMATGFDAGTFPGAGKCWCAASPGAFANAEARHRPECAAIREELEALERAGVARS